jgi:hypothetical protein
MRWLLEFLDARRFVEWYQAIIHVRAAYYDFYGVMPRLLFPQTFCEKVQWRKLFDLDPQLPVFCDKLRVRDFISQRAGADVLPPLLWVGNDPDAVPLESLEVPYVVKSTHASNQTIMVTDAATLDVALACATMKSWLEVCFGTLVDEPGYTSVPRRILVERCLLDRTGKRPLELLYFVFNGRVDYILPIFFENGERHVGLFHDRHWRRADWFFRIPPVDPALPRPERLAEMIELAERLGAGIDHMRVDLYDCGERIYVGELTSYSWSGLMRLHPKMDLVLGAPWRIKHPALRAFLTVLLRRRQIIQ